LSKRPFNRLAASDGSGGAGAAQTSVTGARTQVETSGEVVQRALDPMRANEAGARQVDQIVGVIDARPPNSPPDSAR
jgi:hypothetical protein